MRALTTALLLALALASFGCRLPCAGSDELCLVVDELPEALLCARATADDDVWVSGSEAEPDDSGPTAANWDGRAWTKLDMSAHAGEELWWLHANDDEVVFVGTGGLILEHDRATGATERVDGPDPAITFFGVWGAGDELWAVGGDIAGTLPGDIWRRVGGTWSRFVDPALGETPPGRLHFKVEGAGPDDVWIVGSQGEALHWDGVALTATPTDTEADTANAPLVSISARGDVPRAAGGSGSGLLLRWDGTAWRDETPEFSPPLNGVCASGEAAYAVGQQGTFATLGEDGWVSDPSGLTFDDYHSCDVLPGGAVWAVGGQITRRPLDAGVLATLGGTGVEEPFGG